MEHSVVLETPQNINATLLNNGNGRSFAGGSYRRPNKVDVDELFWIKVQCGDVPVYPLMLYDKTRTCTFMIQPGTSGYTELYEKARAEMGSNGRKTHFLASFDRDGHCRVFPDTADLKSW